jgi:hypothetical protein
MAKGRAGIGQVQGFCPTSSVHEVNMHIACMVANAMHVLQIVNVGKKAIPAPIKRFYLHQG